MPRIDPEFDRNVFLNWPYDQAYAPISEAIVFAIEDSGFHARSARGRLDSSQVRLHKIVDLIRNARFSIHDLSRTQLDETTDLPRFNMPLELGIDIGCKAFSRVHARKSFLIFDSEPHRFHKYLSDIGGQDVQHHGNDPKTAVARVRDWLRFRIGPDQHSRRRAHLRSVSRIPSRPAGALCSASAGRRGSVVSWILRRSSACGVRTTADGTTASPTSPTRALHAVRRLDLSLVPEGRRGEGAEPRAGFAVRPRYHLAMATKRKKTDEEYEAELRRAWARRQNPVPRRDPKSGPPVYFNYDEGTIPLEKILEAVRAVRAQRRKSAK